MKSLWAQTALLILGTMIVVQSFTVANGLLKGRQSYGDDRDFLAGQKKFDSIFLKEGLTKSLFQPEDIFFLSFLNGFNSPLKQLQQQPKKTSNKLPEVIDSSENDIFPEDNNDKKKDENEEKIDLFGTGQQRQKQQQQTKKEVKLSDNKKDADAIISFPNFKTFTDPSGQVGLELDFQVGVPEPETPKKVVEVTSPPTPFKTERKEGKKLSGLDEDAKIFSSLFDLLFPPRPKNSRLLTKPITQQQQQPEQKLGVNRCLDVVCTPPPFESTCEKATINTLKTTSQFNDLGDCCPPWFCTGADGSFHTHYGMSRVATNFNKQDDKAGAKTSSFVRQSSSSHSSSSFVPHLTFPSKIEPMRPFEVAAAAAKENARRQQQQKQQVESILDLVGGRRNSPPTWSFRKTRPVIQPKSSLAMEPFSTIVQTKSQKSRPDFIPFMKFPFGVPYAFPYNAPTTGSSSAETDPIFVSSGQPFPEFKFFGNNQPQNNPFAGWPFGQAIF